MTLIRSYHDTKYVHNIRIWGADAQKLLERTHLLVLGCSATICQVVKNLVLPGIGRFTIVDDRKISQEDRTSNYFMYSDNQQHEKSESYLAKCCCVGLCDLHKPNSNTAGVIGEAILKDPNEFVIDNEAAFREFLITNEVSFVLISNQITIPTIVKLAPILEEANISSAIILVSGFVGYVRLCSPSPVEVVHCMPPIDTVPLDLRITAPFPALRKWLEEHNPFIMTSEKGKYDLLSQIAHVPWFSVLWNAIEIWRKEKWKGPLEVPNKSEMKTEVKEIITKEEEKITGGERKFENFEMAKEFCSYPKDVRDRYTSTMEAINYAKRVIADGSVSQGSDFPFICAALEKFYNDHGRLYPLTGKLPDFPTSTHWYVELCAIYKNQARIEAEEVLETAKIIKKDAGHDPSTLSFNDVEEISANAWELAAVEYTPLSKEFSDNNTVLYADGDYSGNAVWYSALRAAQKFRSCHGRFPGSTDEDYQNDIKLIHADDYILPRPVTTSQSSLEDLSHKIDEVIRGGGGEIPSTASFLGGLAAEEVIKIIQGRRKPVSDAIVFDGFTMSVTTVKILDNKNGKK